MQVFIYSLWFQSANGMAVHVINMFINDTYVSLLQLTHTGYVFCKNKQTKTIQTPIGELTNIVFTMPDKMKRQPSTAHSGRGKENLRGVLKATRVITTITGGLSSPQQGVTLGS